MTDSAKKLPNPPAAGLLPIRTVSMLTGVNAVTLRAWERRYNLVTPQRTPKGHRLYTRQDVERIKQIVDLLSQGISVSHAGPLLEQTPGATATTPAAESNDIWKNYQESMLSAIERFDEPALDGAYNDALSLYPVDIVSQRLTTPLLRLLGERWNKRETGVAEEHFFSVYLRNKLGTRIHHMNQRGGGPLLLLACLPGELHEIGLLFFALAAVNSGYRVLILGANTPLATNPRGARQKSPAPASSCRAPQNRHARRCETDLPELLGQIDTPVFVGGKTSVSQRKKLEQAGAVCLGENIAAGLQLVNKTVNRQR